MIRFLSTKRGGAIVRFAATVLRPFGLSRFASHRFAPLPHIAGFLPHPLALLACAAICVVTNYAIWRLHHG